MSARKQEKIHEIDHREYRDSNIDTGLEALGFVFQLGLTMAVPILIGAVIGEWLDMELSTGRIFLGIMMGIGIAAGFFIAYRQIIPSRKRREKISHR